jgi:opacity protein-like surface antigen
MKFSNFRFKGLFLICFCFIAIKASAESYVGVQTGYKFNNYIDNLRADENTNYPNESGPKPILVGSSLTRAKLDDSFSIGGKIGHYSDKVPFFGIEGEANYSRPDVEKQTFILTNPALLGSTQIPKIQNKARLDDFSAAASLMLRYPAFKRVMPYVGIGPTFHYFRLRGNGADVPVGSPNVTVPGDPIKQDKLSLGLQAKAGVRLAATKHLAVDVEYKYNYSPVRAEFRDLNNMRGGFNSHEIGLALVYRFGKIKW